MQLIEQIHDQIGDLQMLQHPFYLAWMEGQLSKGQLQNYSVQYTPFVESFPRFVSATHSLCASRENRKILLENLLDEEGMGHSSPHPILWEQFAKGVGADLNSPYTQAASDLESVFYQLCRSSYEEGLCALYAYEYQIPQIAEAKIEGLAKHYGVSNEDDIEFFTVHQKADVYHSQACAELIGQIPQSRFEVSRAAARTAAQSLWNFLSSVYEQ